MGERARSNARLQGSVAGAGSRVFMVFAFVAAIVIATPATPQDVLVSKPPRVAAADRVFRCPAGEGRPDGTPCRIAISRIGVDAPVIMLGLEPDGRLEVPTDYSETGWWSGGTKPGDPGPAVIVGHVDDTRTAGVFHRLRELEPGDVVKVWTVGRPVIQFVVDGKGQFPKAEFPSDLVYGPQSFPALRLVTCGGDFNDGTGHYLDNIIVFARTI